MKALVIGATGGIGEAFARELAKAGYGLIVTGQNAEKLRALCKGLPKGTRAIQADLSDRKTCFKLHERLEEEPIDLVINAAGIGVYGAFSGTSLGAELQMLDLNVGAMHILTKCFLADFEKRGRGALLNVASSAGFLAGPLMSSYYAGKSYVLRLSQAIAEELRQKGSPVRVGVLCPGPVDTGFHARAGIARALPGHSAAFVAKVGLKEFAAGKTVILPGLDTKALRCFQRFLPEGILTSVAYTLQKKKGEQA